MVSGEGDAAQANLHSRNITLAVEWSLGAWGQGWGHVQPIGDQTITLASDDGGLDQGGNR